MYTYVYIYIYIHINIFHLFKIIQYVYYICIYIYIYTYICIFIINKIYRMYYIIYRLQGNGGGYLLLRENRGNKQIPRWHPGGPLLGIQNSSVWGHCVG